MFYDYDQLRDRKLTGLKPHQKAIWLRSRLEMILLEPQRRLWDPSSVVFGRLIRTSASGKVNCSFSIPAMVIMLNGIEALGSFLIPHYKARDKNKRRFKKFLGSYMKPWTGSRKSIAIPDLLWNEFRNGVAHGFHIEHPGSLELLEHRRFTFRGGMLCVCPRHFLLDLERGVNRYFKTLRPNTVALRTFVQRFDEIYPN